LKAIFVEAFIMNLKEIIPYILAISAGIFTTLESSINGHIGKIITPKIATIYSLIVGLALMLIITIPGRGLGNYRNIAKLNSRLLMAGAMAGVFGALIIYFVAKTVPSLGVTVTLTLVVAAQILSGLYIDIMVLKHHLDIYKVLGAAAVILGVYFITLKP
jgi:transporter family-2 protein